MKRINWEKANYKDWVGLSAAPVFWLASLVCFVLGLAFKEGTGFLIPGTSTDIIILFSVGLGFANTAIQIVGNDTDKEDLGMALYLMWGASYMLGIGSNVNFLYGAIGLSNWFLQFLVCAGLGVMIEVAPERLLVKFLRSVGILQTAKSRFQSNQHHGQQTQRGGSRSSQSNTEDIPEFLKKLPQRQVQQAQPRKVHPAPTYHPITYQKENRNDA